MRERHVEQRKGERKKEGKKWTLRCRRGSLPCPCSSSSRICTWSRREEGRGKGKGKGGKKMFNPYLLEIPDLYLSLLIDDRIVGRRLRSRDARYGGEKGGEKEEGGKNQHAALARSALIAIVNCPPAGRRGERRRREEGGGKGNPLPVSCYESFQTA